jgi:hypothetical protein
MKLSQKSVDYVEKLGFIHSSLLRTASNGSYPNVSRDVGKKWCGMTLGVVFKGWCISREESGL